jgi:hypothetical protein
MGKLLRQVSKWQILDLKWHPNSLERHHNITKLPQYGTIPTLC